MNKVVKIIITIGSILIIAISSYLICDRYLNKDIEWHEQSSKELKLDDPLVAKLYKNITIEFTSKPMPNTDFIDKTYNSSITKYDDLDDASLFVYAINTLGDKATVDEQNSDDSYTITYLETDVLNGIKKVFGSDKTIPNSLKEKSFSINGNISCQYDDSKYVCNIPYAGGYGMTDIKNLEKATSKGNEIYLYDKYIYIERGDMVDSNYICANIYSNPIDQDLLASINCDDMDNYNDWNSYYELVSNINISFKHTFKKDKNNEYYWYSTEPFTE